MVSRDGFCCVVVGIYRAEETQIEAAAGDYAVRITRDKLRAEAARRQHYLTDSMDRLTIHNDSKHC